MKLDIRKLGEASAIDLSKDDVEILDEILDKTIDFIGEQKELKGELNNYKTIDYKKLRDDKPKESLDVDEALKNTEDKKYSYFQLKEFVE